MIIDARIAVAAGQHISCEKSAAEKHVQMKEYCLWILRFYQLSSAYG